MEETIGPRHIHQALRQVRDVQRRMLATERFRGYSGRCRALTGTLALLAAVVMSRDFYPATPPAHLLGWGVVLVLSLVISYSALLHWFLFEPGVERDPRRLGPTVDALPPLAVGGILSAVLVRHGLFDLLFGTWMCLYGLANLSTRRVFPRAVWPLGVGYILSGTALLFVPGVTFTDPWPMGLVFFVGECVGGWVYHRNRVPERTLASFLGYGRRGNTG